MYQKDESQIDGFYLKRRTGHLADELVTHEFFGPGGCGKDFMMELIMELTGLHRVASLSTSALIDKHKECKSDLAIHFENSNNARVNGGLVPNYPITEAVARETLHQFEKGARVLIRNGYCRNEAQAKEVHNSGVPYLFYHIKFPLGGCLWRASKRTKDRLARSQQPRKDDHPEVVCKRFRSYKTEWMGGLDYIRKVNPSAVIELDGFDRISNRIWEVISRMELPGEVSKEIYRRIYDENDSIGAKIKLAEQEDGLMPAREELEAVPC